MAYLIKNIKKLVQVETKPVMLRAGKDMQTVKCIDNAFLLTDGDKIVDFGKMSKLTDEVLNQCKHKIQEVDASGRMVFPSFCDSHTHIVYKGSREIEYNDKIKGLSYEEIAKRGGGILNSVKKLRKASEDELFDEAWERLEEIISFGTGAVEIKSGYGLSTEDELKSLRVIRRLKEKSPLTIRATFLGAHGVPVQVDALFADVECAAASLLVVPGGTTRYAEHEGLKQQLLAFAQAGVRVAAICASPAVLWQIGLLQGRAATCYPGFEAGCTGATLQSDRAVVVDGNITTGRGPGLALEFALELVRQMAGEDKRQEVAKGLLLA